MKKSIFLSVFAILTLACVGCGEDYADKDKVKDTVMEPVSGLQAESFISSVILTWDMPANENYYYTLITYTDADGNPVNRKVSKYNVDSNNENRVRALIGGFNDTNEYEFTLTHYSFANNASTPVKIKGTPQPRTMAKDYIVKTVKFNPGVESVTVTWENELKADITLKLKWKDYFNYEKAWVYNNLDLPVLEREVAATVPHTEVIKSLPVETDCEVQYCIVDNETGEESETMTGTFQVLPPVEDIFNPAITYFPTNIYGSLNLMSLEWTNDTKNEFYVHTTGNDPYVYTELPGKPVGTTLVFRYKSVQNISGFDLFYKGSGPGQANDMINIQLPDVVAPSGKYNGLRLTNGYWKTVRVDLKQFFNAQFDYDSMWEPDPAKPEKIFNRNRIRLDFGGQTNRDLYFRNMHFE